MDVGADRPGQFVERVEPVNRLAGQPGQFLDRRFGVGFVDVFIEEFLQFIDLFLDLFDGGFKFFRVRAMGKHWLSPSGEGVVISLFSFCEKMSQV